MPFNKNIPLYPGPSKIDIPALFAVLSVSVFAFLFAVEQVYNFDIWWHLKSGEWIIENRKILRYDPFSWSTFGEPWQNISWLSGVLFVLIERIGGIDLLILFKAMLIGLGFGGACFFLVRRGVNPWLAVLILGYTVVAARFRFLLRPTLFMFPFTVVLIWLLDGPASRRSISAFLLFPLTVLWVNLHGSGYLAPVFTSFLLCEKSVDWIFNRSKGNKKPLPVFEFLLTLLVFTALLITPFGIHPVIRVFGTGVMEDLITRSYGVAEHLPLRWGTHNLYWALLFTTFLSFLINWRKTRIFTILMFACTAWIAFSSERYVGIACFVQGILLGLNVQSIFKDNNIDTNIFPWKYINTFFPILLIILGIFAFNKVFASHKVYKWGLGINESRYPVKALEYLEKVSYSGNIFNSWQDGGFILWHYPGIRTSIDGRCIKAQLDYYNRLIVFSGHELQKHLDQNNIKAALLVKDDQELNDFFQISPNFKLGYFDSSHALYFRDDFVGISQAVNEKNIFQYIKPKNFDLSYLQSYATGPQANEVKKELSRAVTTYPDNFSLVLQQAVFLDMRNNPGAVNSYLKAARINPSLGFSHFNLGINGGRAALKHKQWSQGVEILQMALQHGNKNAEIYFLLGTAFYQEKNYIEADKAYKKAVKLEPKNASLLMNLGFLYYDTDNLDKALHFFTEAKKQQNDIDGVYYGIAITLKKMGKSTEAKKAWEEFVTKFPRSKWAQKPVH